MLLSSTVITALVMCHHLISKSTRFLNLDYSFYPTALKGCQGIVFTHGVRMDGRAAGRRLSSLYLGNRKV